MSSASLSFFLALLVPSGASRYVAGVCGDGVKEANVADEERYEEDVVKEEDCCCRSRSWSYKVWGRIDEIVNCDHFGDHVCAVAN